MGNVKEKWRLYVSQKSDGKIHVEKLSSVGEDDVFIGDYDSIAELPTWVQESIALLDIATRSATRGGTMAFTYTQGRFSESVILEGVGKVLPLLEVYFLDYKGWDSHDN